MNAKELYTYYQKHSNICTDTRKIVAGDLFFALKGANFNGNKFAAKALELGAAYVVVDEAEVVADERFLLVDDVLQSLQALARYHRQQLDIAVLAISGSNGKTTTKELVAAVLSEKYKVHFTQGNFNNHIGVPLTLLAMPTSTELAVIEMGANHQGEIRDLCAIAMPTHGLLTNIGQAHLEGFGGIEGVKKGKSELYQHLAAHDGWAFVNGQEAFLPDLSSIVEKRLVYGLAEYPKCVCVQPNVQLLLKDEAGEEQVLNSHIAGRHNLQNIHTAIAVGRYFRVTTAAILSAIAAYEPQNNRSQYIEKAGVHYLLDAYNANPSSMQASLKSFAQQSNGKKLAILGDMLELGEYAQEEHLKIAQYAQSLGLEVYLVGPLFKAATEGLAMARFDTLAELKKEYDANDWQGAHVLIKGSRGMALERLLD